MNQMNGNDNLMRQFSIRSSIPAVLLAILTAGLLLSPDLNAQSGAEKTISGTVTDAENGEPVELVNVFISQTTVGTITDENGEFEFTTRLEGVHELVFSFIGYQSEIIVVDLNDSQRFYSFDAELDRETVEMEELSVAASNVEWQQKFRQFREQFIGTTSNARDTEILNSWVIDFDEDGSGNLLATAQVPLEIVNRALGYKIYVEMVDFQWAGSGVSGFYKAQMRYEELEPGSRRQQRQWERNRERTYRGSFEHFLVSLYNDELRRNQFEVVRVGTTDRAQIYPLSPGEMRLRQLESGRLPSGMDESLKGFRLARPVDILYGHPQDRFRDNRPRSRIVPLNNSQEFFVTEDGRLHDPLAVRVEGHWANHRIANMVPADFMIE